MSALHFYFTGMTLLDVVPLTQCFKFGSLESRITGVVKKVTAAMVRELSVILIAYIYAYIYIYLTLA